MQWERSTCLQSKVSRNAMGEKCHWIELSQQRLRLEANNYRGIVCGAAELDVLVSAWRFVLER